ncbi:mucin-3A-like [Haliotis rubra]|uniref:mucin-3A-like n=1 Tax=Haliotis rubra TaxID=36100 RepID=UPI001EE62BDC|nr:mucin-3A-like [Haliotis rubra]
MKETEYKGNLDDFIAFIPDTEFIFENRTDNCVTLMRAGSANGDITVSYTIGGIGITSPDDFVAGDFQIVYPAASSTIKINVTFNDNTVCDTGTRLINVTLTSLDKGSLTATPLSKFFQVLDDDGEWTEWTTVLGVCDCSTNIQLRTRNRTCDDKGQSFRTCVGDSSVLDTIDCSGDPNCTSPDFIAFIPDTEFIFENRTDNCVTLMRAGSANGDITVSYTIGGIGITSPDDFVAGDFQIVYPAASSTIKINVTFNDNTVCDTGTRLINVTLTSLDKGSLTATPLSKFFQVLDDDGEWTEWTTVLGVCDCSTNIQLRTRNRTCDDKGQSFRTCVGDSSVLDTIDCSGDPNCTSPDFIAFIPDTEFIFENRTDNCVTLMRAGSSNGDITVSYTIGGIGITSPDDFVAGDFQIVYPAASSTIKINVTFNDNTVCDTGTRLINVTLTSLDKGSLTATPLSKFFQVLDDDGEWTEWTTVLGVCECSTSTQPRTRNRTCDDKGQSFRTCVGDSSVMDTVDCSGTPICTGTTTALPTPTTITTTPTLTTTTTSTPTTTPTLTTSTSSIPTITPSLTTTTTSTPSTTQLQSTTFTPTTTPLPTTTALLTTTTTSTPTTTQTLTTTATSTPTTTPTLTTTTTSTPTTTPTLTTTTTSTPTPRQH